VTTAKRPLRVVVVGTRGHAARVAIPVLRRDPATAEFVGLLGSDPARTSPAAADFGVRPYSSVAEVVTSGNADAVWVTAPNHLHAELAEQFLLGGLHVLLEKPMATDIDAAVRLARTAEQAEPVLRVAFQHRFREAHRQLRQALLEERLGELGYLRIHRNWQFPYFPGEEPNQLPDWRASAQASGGWVINDLGSHLVDLAVWLSGQPLTPLSGVFAHGYAGIDNDSSSHLTFGLAPHGIVQVDCSNRLQSPTSLVEAYGTSGWMRLFDSFADTARIESNLGTATIDNHSSMDAYARMLDDFVAACCGEPSDGADARQGLTGVRLVQGARRAGLFVEDASP
jgi:predicted dehydrogenase